MRLHPLGGLLLIVRPYQYMSILLRRCFGGCFFCLFRYPFTSPSFISTLSPAQKRQVAVFFLTYTCYATLYSTRKPLSVVKTRLQDDLGVSTYLLGAIDTAFLGAYAIAQIFLPKFLDQFGMNLPLLGCYLGSAACSLCFGISSTPYILVASWLLNGVCHAAVFPLLVKALTPWINPENRGQVLGIWTTSQQFGAMAATAFAAFIANALDWRSAFTLPAVACALAGVSLYMGLSSPPEAPLTCSSLEPSQTNLNSLSVAPTDLTYTTSASPDSLSCPASPRKALQDNYCRGRPLINLQLTVGCLSQIPSLLRHLRFVFCRRARDGSYFHQYRAPESVASDGRQSPATFSTVEDVKASGENSWQISGDQTQIYEDTCADCVNTHDTESDSSDKCIYTAQPSPGSKKRSQSTLFVQQNQRGSTDTLDTLNARTASMASRILGRQKCERSCKFNGFHEQKPSGLEEASHIQKKRLMIDSEKQAEMLQQCTSFPPISKCRVAESCEEQSGRNGPTQDGLIDTLINQSMMPEDSCLSCMFVNSLPHYSLEESELSDTEDCDVEMSEWNNACTCGHYSLKPSFSSPMQSSSVENVDAMIACEKDLVENGMRFPEADLDRSSSMNEQWSTAESGKSDKQKDLPLSSLAICDFNRTVSHSSCCSGGGTGETLDIVSEWEGPPIDRAIDFVPLSRRQNKNKCDGAVAYPQHKSNKGLANTGGTSATSLSPSTSFLPVKNPLHQTRDRISSIHSPKSVLHSSTTYSLPPISYSPSRSPVDASSSAGATYHSPCPAGCIPRQCQPIEGLSSLKMASISLSSSSSERATEMASTLPNTDKSINACRAARVTYRHPTTQLVTISSSHPPSTEIAAEFSLKNCSDSSPSSASCDPGNPSFSGQNPTQRRTRDLRPRRLTYREVVMLPNISNAAAAYFCVKMIRYSLLFWLPFFLTKQLGYSPAIAGYSSMMFDFGGIAGAVFTGILSDRILGGQRLTAAACMCLASGFSLILFAWASHNGPTMTLVFMGLVGFAIAGPDSVLGASAAQDLVERAGHGIEALSAAAGFINGTGGVGAFLQGYVTAFISETYGWDCLFGTLCLVAVMAFAFLFFALMAEYRATIRPIKVARDLHV